MDHSPPPPVKPYYFVAKRALPSLASIVKIPPQDGNITPYKNLPCSPEDQDVIAEIVTTLSEYGYLRLLAKQTYLNDLGALIDHVHPLKFLSTVFTNPHLVSCMKNIFDDHFKRNGFMGTGNKKGLGTSLSHEADKGRLFPYLGEFAAEIRIPLESIRPFFHTREWEELVYFLMDQLSR